MADFDPTFKPANIFGLEDPDSAPDPELFLRRGEHSSVIVGDQVYIIGGSVSYWKNHTTIDEIFVFGFTNETITIPLNTSWDASTVVPSIYRTPFYHRISPIILPNEEEKSIHVWGGMDWFLNPLREPQPWRMTVAAEDDLDYLRIPKPGFPAPHTGLYAAGKGKGYVFGRNDDGHVQGQGVLDFSTGQWRHHGLTETPGLLEMDGQIPDGAAEFLPEFGRDGLILLTNQTHTDIGHKTLSLGSSWEDVTFYDPTTDSYHRQATSGTIPSPRSEFCLASVRSSYGTYEILLHGGFDVRSFTSLSDTYILTIPGFHWFTIPQNEVNARVLHTCHDVGNSQVLVIGGESEQRHSLRRFGITDPHKQGLGIFNMQTFKWSSEYKHQGNGYEPAPIVAKWYRENDWDSVNWTSSDVQDLFTLQDADPFSSDSFATIQSGSSPTPTLSAGGIAGLVIGIVFVMILLGLLFWRLSRRRHIRHLEEIESREQEFFAKKQQMSEQRSSGSVSTDAFQKAELDGVIVPQLKLELATTDVGELDPQRGGRVEIGDAAGVEACAKSVYELPSTPVGAMLKPDLQRSVPEVEARSVVRVPRDEKGEKTWFVEEDRETVAGSDIDVNDRVLDTPL